LSTWHKSIPPFVGLGSRCGLIERFRQRWVFFTKKVLNMIWYASCNKMQGLRIKWNEVQHSMNEQNDMIWYGGGLNQKQKLA
jgi:hypothetical protein